MKAVITGASGLLGRATFKQFKDAGFQGKLSHVDNHSSLEITLPLAASCWHCIFSLKGRFDQGQWHTMIPSSGLHWLNCFYQLDLTDANAVEHFLKEQKPDGKHIFESTTISWKPTCLDSSTGSLCCWTSPRCCWERSRCCVARKLICIWIPRHEHMSD